VKLHAEQRRVVLELCGGCDAMIHGGKRHAGLWPIHKPRRDG
jgi:hypothetical protein